jgi:hypothetical protein
MLAKDALEAVLVAQAADDEPGATDDRVAMAGL